MKIRHVSVLIALLLSAVAQAGIEQDARLIARDIQRESYRLTPDQKLKIGAHLQGIRGILQGDQGVLPSYSCVPRDNDGRAPYVLATREGLNMIRLKGEEFSSVAACQDMLSAIRFVSFRALVCVSRDRDGRSPYQLAVLGNDVTRLNRTMTGSVAECRTLMNGLRETAPDEVTYCTSRDNDNRSPYQAVSLNVATNQVQAGSEVFNSMAECQAFINL